MADAIPVFMSSRRTVMSGEVVTFATRFEPWDSAFGKTYRAAGPFDVSASRDAVMVHHAECKNREESLALALAVTLAEQVRAALAPHQRGGHPSQYPSEPTLCAPDDGDALRLACALRINIEHAETLSRKQHGVNCWPVGRGDCGWMEDDLTDYNAATRRAIVRAAAEIRKGMETK